MHNINIMFVPAGSKADYRNQKRILDISKSSNALASKKFYEVDYIFQEPTQQKHRNIQRQHSLPNALDKDKTIEAYQKELQKSQLIYKSMMMNMHRSYLLSKEVPKKTPTFINQKDRTQIIHSRKSPRCQFWKRNSAMSTNSARSKQKQNRNANFINLIDPQGKEIVKTPQGKRMSLSFKSDRPISIDTKEEVSILSRRPSKPMPCPESPKRKFWAKTYRPWSPQKRNVIGVDQFCATIDQFTQMNP